MGRAERRRDRRAARHQPPQRRCDLLPCDGTDAPGDRGMSAERAFENFTAAWPRGERPAPAAGIAAASEPDREPLAAMLAAYLAANPREVTEGEVLTRAADPRSDP